MEKFSKEEIKLIKYGALMCVLTAFFAYHLGYQSGEYTAWKQFLKDAKISDCSKEQGYCTLQGTPDGIHHELPY